MITPEYCQMMAKYNAWQNHMIFMAADGLTADERDQDRGAFFGSIQQTLNHLVWGDSLWMARFDGGEVPDGSLKDNTKRYDWAELMALRPQLDTRIAAWAWGVSQAEIDAEFTFYSVTLGRETSRAVAPCIAHFFNHQTHHRGQVHAMLTAAGAETGTTDLFFMPDEVPEWL